MPHKTRARAIAEDFAESERSTAAKNADDFTLAFFEAALWASTDDDGTPLDGGTSRFCAKQR